MDINEYKDQINKKFAKKYDKKVLKTFDDYSSIYIERFSSGNLPLDLALGGNKEMGYGFPVGRSTMISGPQSNGKTTVVLSTVAEAQKNGKQVVWIDAEHCFDFEYAQLLGVDIEKLIMMNPGTMEEAFEIIQTITEEDDKKFRIDLIAIDSIATLLPNVVIEAGYDENNIGTAAKMITKFMGKITPVLQEKKISMIIINQLRDKIGGMSYGPKTTIPGGRGLRHGNSIEIEVRRTENVVEKGEDIGQIIRCKISKNKTAPPQKVCDLILEWKNGINKESGIFSLAVLKNVIEKNGAWYAYDGQKFQGGNKFIEEMKANPELCQTIIDKIIERI